MDNKVYLILRLQEHDPEIWKIAEAEVLSTAPNLCCDIGSRQSTYGEDSVADREFELVRQRDLLRREIELRREAQRQPAEVLA